MHWVLQLSLVVHRPRGVALQIYQAVPMSERLALMFKVLGAIRNRADVSWFEWGDLANKAAVIGLPLTVVAVFYAGRQLQLARRATSASILVPLHESFRQAWLQFRCAVEDDAQKHAFADIFNLLELGCSVFRDGLLVGHSGSLLESYLCHIFALIQSSEESKKRMQDLLHTDSTFENIVAFLRSHKRQVSPEMVFLNNPPGVRLPNSIGGLPR